MESYELIKILEGLKFIHTKLKELETSLDAYTSSDTKDLDASFTKAQGEFKRINKDKSNSFNKASYASLDSMVDSIRPILAKNSLNFKQHIICDKNGYNILITRLYHTSGQWAESRMRIVPSQKQNVRDENQSLGATLTYFKRYSLAALLGLNTGDEDLDEVIVRERR